MTSLKRINVLLLIAILVMSVFSSPLAMLAQSEEVVAKVNGVDITRQQLLDLLEAEYGYYALQDLIQKELVRQRAEELQVSVDEDEFMETYGLIVAQFGGPQALAMVLMQDGPQRGQFIEQLKWNMLVASLAVQKWNNEDELKQWFEQNRSGTTNPCCRSQPHPRRNQEQAMRFWPSWRRR